MFLLLLFASFLDVIGLAALVPVMMVAGEPGGIQKNEIIFSIYNFLGIESEKIFLVLLIVGIFIFFLAKNAFSTWVSYLQTRFTARVGLSVVKSQMYKYLHFPFWHFTDVGSAALVNSTITVPTYYVIGIVRQIFILLSEICIVVVIVVGIFIYKPLLLVILGLVLFPATFLAYRALRVKSQRIGSKLNVLRPATMGIVNELFSGYVELKLANKQKHFSDSAIEKQQNIQVLEAEAYLYTLLPLKLIEMVAILGVITIFLYAILIAPDSTSLISLVGLFAAAAYRLMPSVNRILTAMLQLKTSQYTIEALEKFRGDEYVEAPHPQQLPLRFEQSLSFQNVNFSFPGAVRPTLQDINIDIKKGEKIGFIGSSGSGKTTLMNILLRFYTEQSGHIAIDGERLTSQHLQAWHKIIGYVKQDTFLMEASIKDNITLGETDVDEERLQYAIEQASLQSFIKGLPEGVNTYIGERGSKLSGGQRQRIGIARAMYKKTEILVLDEATSALDNETEREVNEAINKLSQTDITILIIAHRITTLRECDRIYELNEGKIIAEHQYESLIRRIV
ncbi:ABC transporter ATP-binding protein [Hymenobacter guriensis]|nr:ABC transporter ATP-binding protein [Hymenobacter guriensis]